ncbi:MAG TPA: hypothetical protein VII22_08745 [Streptosporangiaceae bacterium]
MRDSAVAAHVPVGGTQLVAGYVNGSYAWTAADWNRFPGIHHITIDVIGDRPDADVLDVETGDATPEGAVQWVRNKLARHEPYAPVLYCNRSTLTPLFDAMQAAGYHVVQHFRLWIATLDGTQKTNDMTGVTAVQYAGEKTTGGNYDQSIVYDDAWKAIPSNVLHGILVQLPGGGTKALSSSDGGKTWS